MSLSSVQFFVFLAIAHGAFVVAPAGFRWAVLLAASWVFYASLGAPHLLVVLAACTALAYAVGLALQRPRSPARRRALLWSGVGGELALLVAARSLPGLVGGSPAAGSGLAQGEALVGAVGVSYFVFQAIAYLANVYLEVDRAEPHLGRFALYLCFFPKLLQGPIERPGELLPQLRRPWAFDYAMARSGLILMAWGVFKKVVVAERLGVTADLVYANVEAFSRPALLLGTYAYAFQLYCDFSGYVDIGRGAARLFGIELSPSFAQPYAAPSIAEFWRRWNMTLSRWLLDYLFKPLQMRWRSLRTSGTALALLITFLACGVWHGATWTFVAWGALHGLYLAASAFYRPLQLRLHKRLGPRTTRLLAPLRVVFVFHLVCVGWIFFRAERLADAWTVVAEVGGSFPYAVLEAIAGLAAYRLPGLAPLDSVIAAAGVALVLLERRLRSLVRVEVPGVVRWAAYGTLFLTIVVLGHHGANTFLYFRF